MGSFAHEITRRIAVQQAAVERDPGDLAAWDEFARVWLSLGYIDRASSCIDRLVASEPQAPRTWVALVSLCFARQRYADALPWAERERAAQPQSVHAHAWLVELHASTGARELAQKELQRAFELSRSDPQLGLDIVPQLLHHDRFAQALDIEQQALEQFLASAERSQLERCLRDMFPVFNQRSAAECAEVQRRLDSHPQSLALRLQWLSCAGSRDSRHRNQGQRALSYLLELMHARPELPGLPEILQSVADQPRKKPGFRNAIGEAWDQILATRATDPAVVANAARYYFDAPLEVQAQRWIARAHELDPTNWAWPTMQAALLLGAGTPEQRVHRAQASIEHLERAAELERLPQGESPELAVALGYACWSCARLKAAARWLELARASALVFPRSDTDNLQHLERTVGGLIDFSSGRREAAKTTLLSSVDLEVPQEPYEPKLQFQLAKLLRASLTS